MPPEQPGPQQLPQYVPQQPVVATAPVASQPPGQPQPAPTQDPNAKQPLDKKTPPPPQNPNSTQNTLLISEIRDNMVIMKDGSFRAVISCKSINFDLMSSREREGVEYSYQNFLNSLNFPIQILVRSQRVDIGPYIEKLTNLRKNQDNMLLNVLMDDYIDFIDVLSQEANIMDKSFYIALPYFPLGNVADIKNQTKGFFAKLFAKQSMGVLQIDEVSYQKAKDEIKNRVDLVTSGLFQMGVNSFQLSTKELGELYYNVYNPDTSVREPLTNFQQNTSIYIKKADTPQPNSTSQGAVNG